MAHFLLPLMQGLRAAGHEVVGVCSDGPFAGRVREEGFRLETVRIDRSFNVLRHIGSYRKLLDFFRREDFDLVHVHTPVAGMIGRLAAWRAGVPRIVYTAHGFYFHEHMAWRKRWLFIVLEWLAGRVTHALFTQAEEDAETARRLHLIRGPVIRAIGNGVDAAEFHPPRDGRERVRIRKKLSVPDDRVVVLVIGRLVVEKGYPELLEAMRSVDAELWIVGERLESDHSPGLDEALEKLNRDESVRDRVRFLGYRSDVPDLMRAADIFTLPSHREGMPRSIVEAMMCALPVVATDVRGSREEVTDGETGFLVSVADSAALAGALNRLAADPALRRKMGEAGREKALKLYQEKDVIARQMEWLGL